MIKLMYCLRRRPDLSRQEFQEYWREKHSVLALSLAGALGGGRYVQCHTIDASVNDTLRQSRSAPPAFDGVVELWFDDIASMEATVSTPEGRAAGRALIADEHNFIDAEQSPIFVVREVVMIEGEPA